MEQQSLCFKQAFKKFLVSDGTLSKTNDEKEVKVLVSDKTLTLENGLDSTESQVSPQFSVPNGAKNKKRGKKYKSITSSPPNCINHENFEIIGNNLFPLSFKYKTFTNQQQYVVDFSEHHEGNILPLEPFQEQKLKTRTYCNNSVANTKYENSSINEFSNESIMLKNAKLTDCLQLDMSSLFEKQIYKEPKYLRKLFLDGLNQDTDVHDLTYYFEQFGPIDECFIIREPKTRRSKCFGYLTFQRASMATKTLSSAPHIIDENEIILFVPNEGGSDPTQFCTLFVGNLDYCTTIESLIRYFRTWGEIVDCYIPRSQNKMSKRFGFVTFKFCHNLIKVLEDEPHKIGNKVVTVDVSIQNKKVQLKSKVNKVSMEVNKNKMKEREFLDIMDRSQIFKPKIINVNEFDGAGINVFKGKC